MSRLSHSALDIEQNSSECKPRKRFRNGNEKVFSSSAAFSDRFASIFQGTRHKNKQCCCCCDRRESKLRFLLPSFVVPFSEIIRLLFIKSFLRLSPSQTLKATFPSSILFSFSFQSKWLLFDSLNAKLNGVKCCLR